MITIFTRRKLNNDIRALLHFDYPYIHEDNDALNDETGNTLWVQSDANNAYAVGSELPAKEYIADTPKFGYRCYNFKNNAFIYNINKNNFWDLNLTKNYEIEFFFRPTSLTSANIFALKDTTGAYPLRFFINTDRAFALTCSGVTKNSTQYPKSDTWQFVKIQISKSTIKIFIDSTNIITAENLNNFATSITQAELGGFTGQVDEFVFRNSTNQNYAIPHEPYQGYLNIDDIGGYGNAKHGNVTISSNCQINTYASVLSTSKGTNLIIDNLTNGKLGNLEIGDEVFIHVVASYGTSYKDVGAYAFRKITAINQNQIVLNEPIVKEFYFDEVIKNYFVQLVSVPNFKNFTVNAGVTVSAKTYDTTSRCGGVIIFRAKSTALINGSLITIRTGPTRTDDLQLTHAKILDQFVLNRGGGIFIAAETFKAPSTARIGATWDGDEKSPALFKSHRRGLYDGGAGYGGGGGNSLWAVYNTVTGAGGQGGVGGGGGGTNGGTTSNASGANGTAGFYGTTGGRGQANSTTVQGGTQGKNPGANGSYTSINGGASSGGGAGGNGGIIFENEDSSCSGASLVLVSNNLYADAKAISTGGQAGFNSSGGGGTGFCYIAAKYLKE